MVTYALASGLISFARCIGFEDQVRTPVHRDAKNTEKETREVYILTTKLRMPP